ncbi:MAG: PEP-CTERM sorting domain-containing protein [Phycisphaeraceae bacterium]
MTASTSAAIIDVGDVDVTVGDSSVDVPITITTDSSEAVAETTLLVQVADGGPGLGSITGPAITGIDFSNSVWEATTYSTVASTGLAVGDFPQLIQYEVLLDISTGEAVPADGEIATITLDTSGMELGDSYDLRVVNTKGGDSSFSGLSEPTVEDGSVTAVPEPATVTLLGLGAIALLRRKR